MLKPNVDSPVPVLRRRILVATSDHAMRKLIASVLRCDGIDAIEAIGDDDALAEVARARASDSWGRPLDIVVLDARRDRRSALRTLAEIRGTDASVRVAVLVKNGELYDTLSCYGAVPLLTPLTASALRATVSTLAPWLPQRIAL